MLRGVVGHAARRVRLWDQEVARQGLSFGKESKTAKERVIAAVVDKDAVVDWARRRPSDDARPLTLDDVVKEDAPNNALAQGVYWHSSAHILGGALENLFGDDLLLCDGPAMYARALPR